eukprot:8149456-Prorocentrum_lima.AAC.1
MESRPGCRLVFCTKPGTVAVSEEQSGSVLLLRLGFALAPLLCVQRAVLTLIEPPADPSKRQPRDHSAI